MYHEFKENHLFWLMFIVFFFIWLFSTVIFWSYCKTNNVEIDATLIGSYANILVFNATIFAPIAAYFFIDNWKEQNNKTLFSAEAKKLWLQLQKIEDFSYKLDRLIMKRNIINYNQENEFEVFFESLTDTLNNVHYFIELTGDKRIGQENDKYITKNNDYEELLNSNFFNVEIDEENRELLLGINQNIRKLLKNYIIIK